MVEWRFAIQRELISKPPRGNVTQEIPQLIPDPGTRWKFKAFKDSKNVYEFVERFQKEVMALQNFHDVIIEHVPFYRMRNLTTMELTEIPEELFYHIFTEIL